ncbi:hypothetical protein MMC13_006495 [Lambiella insularis]|nr:hypothetical protein [Lambiella insularis]
MQGFNMGRYVPPEHEGTISANKLAGKHALGSRARKAGQGILTVRFEMPFPIWCSSCAKPSIIGQGVRFNAEKKKVGAYYSTPIFSFRMKHAACGGWIEIRTDPKNTAYVVREGATKRDTGEGRVREGEIVLRTEEERERLQSDAFAALEVKIDDRRQATVDKGRIEELLEVGEKDWEDPYAASRRLRRAFRADRKVREKDQAATEALQDRMGLGLDLLPESEEDRRRAGFVEFGELGQTGTDVAVLRAQAKPLFPLDTSLQKPVVSSGTKSKEPKAEQVARRQKEALRRELQQNTRAVLDPFLTDQPVLAAAKILPGIKRKRGSEMNGEARHHEPPSNAEAQKTPLVDYESE